MLPPPPHQSHPNEFPVEVWLPHLVPPGEQGRQGDRTHQPRDHGRDEQQQQEAGATSSSSPCLLSFFAGNASQEADCIAVPRANGKTTTRRKSSRRRQKKKKTSQELERSKVRRTNKQKEKKNAESHAFLSFTWLIFGGYIQICHIFRQKGRGGWCVETHLNPDKSTTTCQH